MLSTTLSDPDEIDRYLGSLRCHDRRSWRRGEAAEAAVRRLLRAPTITVERGERDSFEGEGVSLETWLSLLDDPERRARVSEVRLDMAALGSDERQLRTLVVRSATGG